MIQLCNRRVGGVDVQGGGGGCSSIRSMRGAKKGKRARRTCVKGYARWQGVEDVGMMELSTLKGGDHNNAGRPFEIGNVSYT